MIFLFIIKPRVEIVRNTNHDIPVCKQEYHELYFLLCLHEV